MQGVAGGLSRGVQWGYRLRWLYVIAVVILAIVWWGLYPGQYAWNIVDYGDNPVLTTINLIANVWTGGLESWYWRFFDLDPLWGIAVSDFPYYSWQAMALCVFDALGVPLLVSLGCVVYVGIGRSVSKEWPARRRLSWPAMCVAAIFAGMLCASVVLGVLNRTPVLDVLDRWSLNWSQGNVLFAGAVRIATEPFAWWAACSVLCLAWMVWLGAGRVYWRQERVTRWLCLLSVSVLAACSAGWVLGRGLGPHFFDGFYETAVFSSATTLLWASVCRVWLLCRFQAFEAARLAASAEDPLCEGCGYNLRGSLPGGRRTCPECGMRVPDGICVKENELPSVGDA